MVWAVEEVVRRRSSAGKSTVCVFLDVCKAYDTVWCDGLWDALWQKGVRGRMWRVLQAYYAQVQSCVRVGAETTDWFEVQTGVRQGCVLSPSLFAVFFDGLLQELRSTGLGVQVDGVDRLCALAYADDVVLLADSQEELQQLVGVVCEWCRKWCRQLNVKKTKVMVFGQR